MEIRRAASLHYKGQIYELTVPAPGGAMDTAALGLLAERFADEHEKTYGHRASAEEPVELVHLELVARGLSDSPRVPERLRTPDEVVSGNGSRLAYFGEAGGWVDTRVLRRVDLFESRDGPMIIEEYDSTCLVPPGASAWRDEWNNIRIRVGAD